MEWRGVPPQLAVEWRGVSSQLAVEVERRSPPAADGEVERHPPAADGEVERRPPAAGCGVERRLLSAGGGVERRPPQQVAVEWRGVPLCRLIARLKGWADGDSTAPLARTGPGRRAIDQPRSVGAFSTPHASKMNGYGYISICAGGVVV